MYNIISGITQLSINIIKNSNEKKFRYHDYYAILEFKLLLYIVKVVAHLGEYCNFFWLKSAEVGYPLSNKIFNIKINLSIFYLIINR